MQPLLGLIIATLLAAQAPDPKTPRKPHPLAPSLPLLTDEEEAKLDQIVDRFILFDTGQLPGAEGLKAKQEFDRLGPEATFALIRGLNKSAQIEHSCPVVVIAKKLNRILGSTSDMELLEFARENIGAGAGRTRHSGVLQELRLACAVRKNALARNSAAKAGPKPPRTMTLAELVEAAGSERGPRLKEVLIELEGRRGAEVIAALGTAAAAYEGDVQALARDLLVRHLSRQEAALIKTKLKDERAEVRRAAVLVAGLKDPRLAGDVIDLLADSDAGVRAAARQTLLRLSRGLDLGPAPNATEAEQKEAVRRWREWWSRQGIR